MLANNCSDGTVEQARRFAAATPALRLHVVEILLPPPHAHVGAARRLVMDEACRRLASLGRQRGVIATTDGDTLVRPTWVASNLEEIARGADAVGGRILATPGEVAALDAGTRLYYRRDTAYRTLRTAYESILNPDPANAWPRHHHCFGASLAVTVQAYLAAGGLPVVHCLEDMAFVRALERRDARVRRSPAVNVRTSLRCSGRVDVGLSWTLSKWTRAAALGEPLLLESPDTIAWEAMNRRCLRKLWEGRAHFRRAGAGVGLGGDAGAPTQPALARGGHGGGVLPERVRTPAADAGGSVVAAAHGGAGRYRHPASAAGGVASQPARGDDHSRSKRVEPVAFRPLPGFMKEGSVPGRGEELFVNRIARQRVVMDERGPVNQQQVATQF